MARSVAFEAAAARAARIASVGGGGVAGSSTARRVGRVDEDVDLEQVVLEGGAARLMTAAEVVGASEAAVTTVSSTEEALGQCPNELEDHSFMETCAPSRGEGDRWGGARKIPVI